MNPGTRLTQTLVVTTIGLIYILYIYLFYRLSIGSTIFASPLFIYFNFKKQ